MKDVRLVIFDMDGLLFDTERLSYLAMKRAIEKLGFDFPLDNYKRIIGAGDYESDSILKEIYKRNFSLDEILEDYQREFQNILYREGLTVKPGVSELLDKLDNKGIKRCIASSSSGKTIHKYLSLSGLLNRFDFYVSGEEVESGKPNPDIFIEACKRAEEVFENSLVLEDSHNGLRAANSAGIACIIIPDIIEPNEEMRKKAYRIFPSLNDVLEIF